MKKNLEEIFWGWCSKNSITRRGYNGKNKLDRNNSSQFLSCVTNLKSMEWWPVELNPVVDCLVQLRTIKDKTFSWDLKDGWEESIDTYKQMYSRLQVYCTSELDISLSCTWKVHIIAAHLKPFLTMEQCGLARFAEQTGESVHHRMKPVLQNHGRKDCHPEHGRRQKNAVVEFSSNNK